MTRRASRLTGAATLAGNPRIAVLAASTVNATPLLRRVPLPPRQRRGSAILTVVRAHEWIDRRSLALHGAVAAKLEAQPELLDLARANLQRWLRLNPAHSCNAGAGFKIGRAHV